MRFDRDMVRKLTAMDDGELGKNIRLFLRFGVGCREPRIPVNLPGKVRRMLENLSDSEIETCDKILAGFTREER